MGDAATAYDLILVGAGLANGLVALRLRELRPELRILMLEQGAQAGGNHTWSFHDSDLTGAQNDWIAPLVSHRWPSYDVVFPELRRTLHGGYASVESRDFARVLTPTMGDALRTGVQVASLSPTQVTLADGQTLHARAVIDGRGMRASSHLALGYQTFLGQEVRLAAPHGLNGPTIMDASVAQQGGYRFVYLLPFGPDRVLIEDTHYVDSAAWEPQRLRANIGAYAAGRGWRIDEIVREEQGSLPIVLACSTPPPAIRCRMQCAWPSTLPNCPTCPRPACSPPCATMRARNGRRKASSACSTACCFWPAAPTTAGA
jgi:lycopene beta-cyclase